MTSPESPIVVVPDHNPITITVGHFATPTPTSTVISVNGRTGPVVLTASDVEADPAGSATAATSAEATLRSTADTALAARLNVVEPLVTTAVQPPAITALQTALDLKADSAATTTALASKADGAATTTALSAKADAAATTASLAAKADAATAATDAEVTAAILAERTSERANASGTYRTSVTHAAVAGTARPTGVPFGLVDWTGSVAPTNVTPGDRWWDTTSELIKRWTGTAFVAVGSTTNRPALVVGPRYGSYTLSGSIIQAQGAIQGAIDAARQQGGGTVIIPPGIEHRADRIVVPKFVHLRGDSWHSFGDGASRIRQNGGINADFVIVSDNGDAATRPFVGPFGVSDLVLLGIPGSTAGHGLAIKTADGRTGFVQDITTFERLVLSYFAQSGFWSASATPLHMKDIVTFWNGGYGLEILDGGVDTANKDLHHVSLENIAGDGNMGYVSDGGGATVYIANQKAVAATTIRGVKSEYRPLPVFQGGDGVRMGNAHAVILDNCESDIDVTGVTHISTGSQTRRPDAPVLVKGAARPNLTWRAIGVRGAHPAQTGPVQTTRVRDTTQLGVTVNYAEGHGDLGAVTDTAADPDFTTGHAAFNPGSVNGSSGPGSGTMRLSYFTAKRTHSVATVRTRTTAAATGGTLCRLGLYEVAADGALTLVASTPNDTTMWSAANVTYAKALSAAAVLRKAQRYAWGLLFVGTTAPSITAQTGGLSSDELARPPRRSGLVASTVDLPASVPAASVGDTSLRLYIAAE